MFCQIIPAWKKIIEERGADITLNFGDICFTEYFEDLDQGSIIAMQNLNTLGYRDAINKKRGLSPKHVRLALDEMAKYHALGYAWTRNYPGGVEQALKDEEVRNNSHLMLTLGQPKADHSGCHCGCVDIKAKAVF